MSGVLVSISSIEIVLSGHKMEERLILVHYKRISSTLISILSKSLGMGTKGYGCNLLGWE